MAAAQRAEALTILVTGATAGIGFATAAGRAELGHPVVVTGRDEERGRSAVEEIPCICKLRREGRRLW